MQSCRIHCLRFFGPDGRSVLRIWRRLGRGFPEKVSQVHERKREVDLPGLALQRSKWEVRLFPSMGSLGGR